MVVVAGTAFEAAGSEVDSDAYSGANLSLEAGVRQEKIAAGHHNTLAPLPSLTAYVGEHLRTALEATRMHMVLEGASRMVLVVDSDRIRNFDLILSEYETVAAAGGGGRDRLD
ncbi:hypothetical protein GL218_00817 [Daldinia childiae]|uniref:uncharacterized protein n=1 Tax=Daldinia childiae TaxID=326645 RepID=UPI001445766F|nr:uncharacterized protein GL218_00817 [Daldinia childiae]KAF3070415.1 hypothetical protein GL218_00817 [Daldinia childiae]